jgi:hypothetical protein
VIPSTRVGIQEEKKLEERETTKRLFFTASTAARWI